MKLKTTNIMKLFKQTLHLLVLLLCVSTTTPTVYAQNSKLQKELEKQRTKVYKKLVQEYKKEGWKLANNNTTIEVAVLEHLTKLDDPSHNWIQETGEVSKCKSMNVGRMAAVNNAQNKIAQQMQGQIEGFVSSLVSSDAENLDAEQDKMVAAFVKKINITLNGALQESYAIYKENPDGTTHYKAFFLVDKGKCLSAVNAAVERSLKDTGVAIDMADQIRDFVHNGLTIDE